MTTTPPRAAASEVGSVVSGEFPRTLLHETKVSSDPQKYLERLSRADHILTGEYTAVGKDLYQTERIRKSLVNKACRHSD